ncbi:biotin transporter BioY [Prochlorococcus sp. MIT 0801]|uniref:biotin transporter BioY n=1 Tax=Prochlorococcus sp. MIT 0801 TaxID=1501269 RepID=UPI0004F8B0DF|nr:biotin transporter BioY [Prochlorococcus sp. MIT 0801]AIQ96921.1 Substrate-specific component BioY of biotin ECF transporter [Prochlorococcus sp. MIT 0801]
MHKFTSWTQAITGVMLIIICSMIPSSIISPQEDLSLSITPLHSNWQIQGVLLTSLVCGPQIGTISAISYLIIGLFYLPVFHGGGSVGYILTHEFGYLLGFIPAAWICGFLAKKETKANLINYSLYTATSLCAVHIIGIIYLIIGKVFGKWLENLSDLILINTFIPLPTQLLLCISISLLSIFLRRVLIIK